MNRATSISLGGSSRTGLLLALILAVVAGVLVFAVLQSQTGGEDTVKTAAGGELVTVVTAKSNIPARTEITADMVELTRIPSNALLAGAFTESDLVVGRVARIPVYKGEQLVQEKFAVERSDLGLSYIVPDGSRAMAVEVDKVVGAGGLIRPGDRVDVVAVIDITYEDLETERQADFTRSFIVAQNIEVLAVEQELENRLAPASGEGAESATAAESEGTLVEQPEAQPEAAVATLALTPQEMQRLLLADEKGAIRLAVRAPGDDEVVPLDDLSPLALTDEDFQAFLQELLSQPQDQ